MAEMRTRWVLLVAVVVVLSRGTDAQAWRGCHTLEIQMVSWEGNGRDAQGDRCDNIIKRACDPYFYICVDTYLPSTGGLGPNEWDTDREEMSPCFYTHRVQRSREYDGRNSVRFGSSLRSGFANPMVFKEIHEPWDGARLYVLIEDNDHGNPDDIIDRHQFDLRGRDLDGQGFRWAYPYTIPKDQQHWIEQRDRGRLYARTNSFMKIYYKATCCRDYYNYNCSIFCIDQDNSQHGHYTCDPLTGDKVCIKGYKDPDTRPPCITPDSEDPDDPCEDFRCGNGGTAYQSAQICECFCPQGTTGRVCQTMIDYCVNNPCQNGATCSSQGGTYVCRCAGDFAGRNCDLTRCQTDDITCENGGVCVQELNGCRCNDPFTGPRCSICDCSGHGNCDLAAGKCKCFPGWVGGRCDVDVCDHKICLNGGKCVSGECLCKIGFGGDHCETQVACGNDPCQNGGTCNPLNRGYRCECIAQFHGPHCELHVNRTVRVGERLVDEPDVEPVEGSEGGMLYWHYILIALFLLIVIIVILVALLWRQKRKRKEAEAQTENLRNGMANFDNPLYGNENHSAGTQTPGHAQTQTYSNGVATGTTGTQVYDSPKKKGFFGGIFGGKSKGNEENPYDDVQARPQNNYDYPRSSNGAAGGAQPPPLPKRSTKRDEGAAGTSGRRDKPPAYLSGAPELPVKVNPRIERSEPTTADDDEYEDPVQRKRRMAEGYSRA